MAQRFELEVRGHYLPLPLPEKLLGVRLVPLKSAKEVKKVKSSAIDDNTIYFYTKSKKQGVFYLLKHFRNCTSHKNRITKKQKDGEEYYQFEDKTKAYVSLQGKVSVEKWDEFIEQLYTEALANKTSYIKNSE